MNPAEYLSLARCWYRYYRNIYIFVSLSSKSVGRKRNGDCCIMAAEFLGRPFMGPPSVPHVNEEFFKMYFLGAHVSRISEYTNGML